MSRTEIDDKYQNLIATCDAHIKSWRIEQVAALISELNFAQVPRMWRQPLAKICRRAVLYQQGLRLLQPLIRQEMTTDDPATASELCEYAVLLIRNGSVQEAETLLKAEQASKTPESLLYLSFCAIHNWDYTPAAEYLGRFLNSSADESAKLIARVNLASCYVVLLRLNEATELLNESIELAQKTKATRLIGNCYELLGQVHFWHQDFSRSREHLDRALGIFGTTESYDQLLILKTQSIMTSMEQNSLAPLVGFRKKAMARKHWESVRESDLFMQKLAFEQEGLDHLIFGTPFQGYRERILRTVGAAPSSKYILGHSNSLCLDLVTGEINGNIKLKPGRKIHQILGALVRDFYAPRNIGQLFSDLYPGEYFNIDSSGPRVRQLMMRARQWLKENQIAATVEHDNGTYRLSIHGKFGIQIPLELPGIDHLQVRWQELRTHFASSTFNAEMVCSRFGWPRTTFRRVVMWALETGLLEKSGVGKATRYQIRDSQKSELIKKAV